MTSLTKHGPDYFQGYRRQVPRSLLVTHIGIIERPPVGEVALESAN